jgi:molecular chaperone DnaK (HSP70)
LGDFLVEGLKSTTPGENASVNVRFDFDVNGMLHVSAVDHVGGAQQSLSVQATQSRLTPHDIAEARDRLTEIDLSSQPAYLAEAEADEQPVIDEETQALIKRAQTLLENGSLSEAQSTRLTELTQEIFAAETQDDLDELAEELLDVLFDLE